MIAKYMNRGALQKQSKYVYRGKNHLKEIKRN